VISKINRKSTEKTKIIFVRWHYVALLINFQRGFFAQVRTISVELATHGSLLDCMKGANQAATDPIAVWSNGSLEDLPSVDMSEHWRVLVSACTQAFSPR
jgi:hypothetical protein